MTNPALSLNRPEWLSDKAHTDLALGRSPRLRQRQPMARRIAVKGCDRHRKRTCTSTPRRTPQARSLANGTRCCSSQVCTDNCHAFGVAVFLGAARRGPSSLVPRPLTLPWRYGPLYHPGTWPRPRTVPASKAPLISGGAVLIRTPIASISPRRPKSPPSPCAALP